MWRIPRKQFDFIVPMVVLIMARNFFCIISVGSESGKALGAGRTSDVAVFGRNCGRRSHLSLFGAKRSVVESECSAQVACS